jgi:hypothetical protein
MSILGILFSWKERGLSWPHGKKSNHQDLRFSPQTGNFPLEDPHWNNNNPANRKEMGGLRI